MSEEGAARRAEPEYSLNRSELGGANAVNDNDENDLIA